MSTILFLCAALPHRQKYSVLTQILVVARRSATSNPVKNMSADGTGDVNMVDHRNPCGEPEFEEIREQVREIRSPSFQTQCIVFIIAISISIHRTVICPLLTSLE